MYDKIVKIISQYEEKGDFTIIEIETNFDERFYALKNCYLTINVEKLNIYDENL